MQEKEYKVVTFRIPRPMPYASEDLELFINGYAKKGWSVKTIMFHSNILSYEIMLERNLRNG